jgi:uncharacterized protein (DUF1684 family)
MTNMSNRGQSEAEKDREYIERLNVERAEKDHKFKVDLTSPIPNEERSNFKGLKYYSIDPAYRFSVQLHKHSNPKTLFMMTTKKGDEEYIRVGYFEFIINGKLQKLQVYRTGPTNPFPTENLFIAFRDKTSGSETYGSGRYIELPEDKSGTCTLDFNTAHNPLCAYSDAHSCPIAPGENQLDVEIKAGEKIFREHVAAH